ncbi:hypothetical protein E0W68_03095 [Flavobacterium salilacus subsp. salilacus]|uniref:hypothetical protein n=1 Tax=Flavobacterium TaxID=237 RepID=UPI00107553BF|nr:MULTISPECIES: hypothetical protein [Flavobacterium]KAF2519349.1 hypothetical protein E0W68_03095 [Flavobacterium salilacus subsp. salilacus]MBE1614760.1 hypothetical protein [Flavobacterium sp. SaA2.13]
MKSATTKKLLFLLLLSILSQKIFSQLNIQFQQPKSPEAYLFEKYGSMPIANYSGKPNVNIPLYTINYGDINIPLSLSYTSNGIRVDEEASQVGLGWYFGTGMISQIVNGKDDLRDNIDVLLPDFFYQPYPQYVLDNYPRRYFDAYPIGNIDPMTPDRLLLDPADPISRDKYFMGRVRTDGSFSNFVPYPRNGQLYDYKPVLDWYNNPYFGDDMEIDLFKANFFGHEIIFYYSPINNTSGTLGSVSVLSGDKYAVKLINNGSNTYSFKITAPDGTSYFFEEELVNYNTPSLTSSGYTTNLNDTSGTGYQTFTSVVTPQDEGLDIYTSYSRIWKITKIEDTKGNIATFNYTDLPKITSTTSKSSRTEFLNVTYRHTEQSLGLGLIDQWWPLIGPEFGSYQPPTGKHIHYYRNTNATLRQDKSCLSSIEFGDSELIFNNTDRIDIPYDKKLSGISVLYKNNIVKNINLEYDYFNSAYSSNNTQKRLKLLSVQDGDNSYKFKYNNTPFPNKNSNSFDYWGFYNGAPNTTASSNPFRLYEDSSLIPQWAHDLMPSIEGIANRSAHSEYCKIGILEEIEYPTGGTTEFIYELNEFDNYFFPDYNNKTVLDANDNFVNDYPQTISRGFGLRIKETIDRPGDGTSYKTKYTYSGGKHIPPYVAYNDSESHYTTYNDNQVCGGTQCTYYTVTSGNKIMSYNNSLYQTNILGNGDGVGYDTVTVEKVSSNTVTTNGKTEHFYTNVPDVSARDKFGFGVPKSLFDMFGFSIRPTDLDNGLLTQEIVYDIYNTPKFKKEYTYQSILPTIYTSTTASYNVKVVKVPGNYGYPRTGSGNHTYAVPPIQEVFHEYLFFYYPLRKTKNLLKNQTVTEYFDAGNVIATTSYEYDNFYRKKSITVADPNRGIEKQTIDYYTSYQTSYKNQLMLPQRTRTYQGNLYGNQELKEERYYFYNDPSNLVSRVKVRPRGTQNPNYEREIYYDQYDDKGNIIEYHVEDGNSTCVIWGYNKTLPIATIENVAYGSVVSSYVNNLQTLSNSDIDNCRQVSCTEQALRTALNNLRSAFPQAMVTTYTYDPLIGITSMTDPKGYTSYYGYDSQNRLKYIKDEDGNILEENEYNFKSDN